MRADRGRPPRAPDEHALVSRLAEHAIAVRPGTTLGIPGTVRVSVPSQRGLRLLHGALRPTLATRKLRIPVTSTLFSMILMR